MTGKLNRSQPPRGNGFLYFNSPCLRAQNDYTVPQAHDPRPTSSAFPQRRPTAEAKGGILPDPHGEPSL